MSAAITRVDCLPYRLPLRSAWRFGNESLLERRGFLLKISDENGRIGWGEAAPLPQIGSESLNECRCWLREQLPSMIGRRVEPQLEQLPDAAACPPAARCGLETALLDLSAQRRGVPLRLLLAATAKADVAVNAAVGNLADTAAEDITALTEAGYNCLKLKVGAHSVDDEAAALKRLAESLAPSVQLRLDANRAWSPAQAERFIEAVPKQRIAYIEEPMAGDFAALADFRQRHSVAVAADESLRQDTLAAVVDAGAADLLILKPMRLGGLLPCLSMARQAAKSGLGAVVTTTLDGAVAGFAAAQLAAALDSFLPPTAHGLATAGWLARDLAAGPTILQGRLYLPTQPGLGCVPDESRLSGAEF